MHSRRPVAIAVLLVLALFTAACGARLSASQRTEAINNLKGGGGSMTEPVFERIATIARIHCERLAMIRNHPAVTEVRSIGTMAAVELRADDAGYFSKLRPKLYQFFLNSGVLLRPLGNVIYILPPYCIEAKDLHRVYDVIEDAIGAVA